MPYKQFELSAFDRASSGLLSKHMDSENTWTPKKNRLSHSEYEIIAHQSIRKFAASVAMASIFNDEQEFRSLNICGINSVN